MASHRDPTFEEVSRRESRSCHQCIYRTVLWGLAYCTKKKWAGVKNERRCNQWDSGIKGINVIKQ